MVEQSSEKLECKNVDVNLDLKGKRTSDQMKNGFLYHHSSSSSRDTSTPLGYQKQSRPGKQMLHTVLCSIPVCCQEIFITSFRMLHVILNILNKVQCLLPSVLVIFYFGGGSRQGEHYFFKKGRSMILTKFSSSWSSWLQN